MQKQMPPYLDTLMEPRDAALTQSSFKYPPIPPSHPSIPPPSRFCAIILVQGVPHSLLLPLPFLFLSTSCISSVKSHSRDLIEHLWAAWWITGHVLRSHDYSGLGQTQDCCLIIPRVGYRELVQTGTISKRFKSLEHNNKQYSLLIHSSFFALHTSFVFFSCLIAWHVLGPGLINSRLIQKIEIRMD